MYLLKNIKMLLQSFSQRHSDAKVLCDFLVGKSFRSSATLAIQMQFSHVLLIMIVIIIVIIIETIFIQANLFSKINLLLSTKDL